MLKHVETTIPITQLHMLSIVSRSCTHNTFKVQEIMENWSLNTGVIDDSCINKVCKKCKAEIGKF